MKLTIGSHYACTIPEDQVASAFKDNVWIIKRNPFVCQLLQLNGDFATVSSGTAQHDLGIPTSWLSPVLSEAPAKTAIHTLTVGGGQVITDGKSHYPDFVRIIVPRDRILDLATELLDILKKSQQGNAEISIFGELQANQSE
jgi:hypothetical protein